MSSSASGMKAAKLLAALSGYIDTSSLTDPLKQLKISVFEGALRVDISGKEQEIQLPDDVFTDDASAKVEDWKLIVTIPRRDLQGPAQQEKRLLNPDRHPVSIDVHWPKDLLAKSAKAQNPSEQLGGKTPAQQTLTERNPALYGEPDTRYKMPEVNMGSSIVTAMPVMDNAGGAVDTVSKGETVVSVPGMVGNKHLTGVESEGASAEELADKMRDTVIRDQATKGATVLFGQKEKQNEAMYDESAAKPHMGTAAGGVGGEAAGGGVGVTGLGGEAATAGAGREAGGGGGGGGATAESPAGDDEEQLAHQLATGARGEKVKADFTQNKVGMEYEELTAADRYVTSESRDNEPISSMKQRGDKCDMCACNPCQCDKVSKTGATGGTGSDPYELTYPQQKRGGKPAIHRPHKEQTGKAPNRDTRGHASQSDPGHIGIGGKLADWKGDVPEGQGEWSDPKYAHKTQVHGAATHAGGSTIDMGAGGPGKSQVSDAVKGGPVKGGHKTNFTTLG